MSNCHAPGLPVESGRWREVTSENPTCNPAYHNVPYRALLSQGGFNNRIVAARKIDMDPVAHAAVRVTVDLKRTGEAGGVAPVLILGEDRGFFRMSIPTQQQAELAAGKNRRWLVSRTPAVSFGF